MPNLITKNKTPFISACGSFKTNINIVNCLIKAGADVNLKAGGRTPLTVVLCSKRYRIHSCAEDYTIYRVKALIKAGVTVNLKAGYETPLIINKHKLTAVLNSNEIRTYLRKKKS